MYGFQKRGIDNQTWTYGWSSATLRITPPNNPGVGILWLQQPTSAYVYHPF